MSELAAAGIMLPERDIGIGRPLSTEFVAEVDAALSELLPAGAVFRPRTIPGIVYLHHGELRERAMAQFARPAEYPLDKLTDEIIASMCQLHLLDEEAAKMPTLVNMDWLMYRGGSSLSILARVVDRPAPYYPDGLLFRGEGGAIRRYTGVKPVEGQLQGRTPTVYARVGNVSVSGAQAIPDGMPGIMYKARKRTGKRVGLGPVGAVAL